MMYHNSSGAITKVNQTAGTSGIYPVEKIYSADLYAGRNLLKRAAGKSGFPSVMRSAAAARKTSQTSALDLKGDMVITQPSCQSLYAKNTSVKSASLADMQLSEKQRSEMTMEAYKKWFRDKVSAVQTEYSANASYLSDTLVIKEDAFEKMKSDVQWEQSVMEQIKDHYVRGKREGGRAIGFQVVGASPEACYENVTPLNVSAYTSNQLLLRNGYTDYTGGQAGQSWLQSYLLQSMISGQGTNDMSSDLLTSSGLGLLGYSPYGMGGMVSTAYKNTMNNLLTGSLLGSQLI